MLTAIVITAITSGCTVVRPVMPEVGHYYINPDSEISTVKRVVVFELENESKYPEISKPVTETLAQSMVKRHLFSIWILEKKDPLWRRLDLHYQNYYSNEQLLEIREQLRADAIVFGKIKEYQSYPHLTVGLHMKMVDLRDGQILWATEQLWDSTDRKLEYRMKRYYDNVLKTTGYEPLEWEILTTSPKHFRKFVSYEVAQTLPNVKRYRIRENYSSENSGDLNRKSTIMEKTKEIYRKTKEIPRKTLKFARDATTIHL
jgi:hypothetical protein